MKYLFLLTSILLFTSHASQLKVVAKSFNTNEKSGITVFSGDVQITKDADELNASEVTVYTNAKRKPTKYVAQGSVSFFIETENKTAYRGTAGKVIFVPATKEYLFYKSVHIEQLNDKKEINGEEVVISTVEGKAHAKGGSSKPVIMTFEIEEESK